MNINRNNCEAFFLDYHEGRLTLIQASELLLFLEQHADLKQVFESFENISLDEENIVFNSKYSLRKSPNSEPACSAGRILTPDSFEELCVGDVEGEISFAQKKELTELIYKNASLNEEYQLYKKTKLVPEAIIFEEKFLLRKQFRTPNYKLRSYYYAAAASVLLILGLFFLLRNDNATNKIEIASNSKTEAPVITPEKRVFPEINNKSEIAPIIEKKNTSVAQNTGKKNKHVFPKTNNMKEYQIIVPEKQKQNEPQLTINEEKKELPKLPVIKKEATPLVIVENKLPTLNSQLLTDEYLSLKEIVTSKIKTKLLADELPEQESKGDNLKKFKLRDVAVLVAKGVHKLTGNDVTVDHKYDKNNQVTVTTLHIGNFSVEHTVATR